MGTRFIILLQKPSVYATLQLHEPFQVVRFSASRS